MTLTLTKIFHTMRYRIILGVTTGAVLGYLYYYFIGCLSGTCPIQSNPLTMTLYGAILGGLIIELIHDFIILLQQKFKTR